MTATPNNGNVPDSISGRDLEALMQSAPDGADTKDAPLAGLSQNEFLDELEQILRGIDARFGDDAAFAQKMLIMMMTSNWVGVHSKIGKEAFKAKEKKAGVCWLRDAGKLQAIMCILKGVDMGPNDFIVDRD